MTQGPSQRPGFDPALGDHHVVGGEKNRNPLSISLQQPVILVDIDLTERQIAAFRRLFHQWSGLVAEMTAGPGQENEQKILN